MKRLLLLLILLLSGCKYGSEFEANNACYKWREKQYEKKNTLEISLLNAGENAQREKFWVLLNKMTLLAS